jgi:hypothetical protein
VSESKNPVLTVPVGRPLTAAVKMVFAADLVPLLIGGTGIGKSATLEGLAGDEGWECLVLDLSQLEPPDLIGLPKLDGKVTRYLPPAFLPAGPGRGYWSWTRLTGPRRTCGPRASNSSSPAA